MNTTTYTLAGVGLLAVLAAALLFRKKKGATAPAKAISVPDGVAQVSAPPASPATPSTPLVPAEQTVPEKVKHADAKRMAVAKGYPGIQSVPLTVRPNDPSREVKRFPIGTRMGRATGKKQLLKNPNGSPAWFLEIRTVNGQTGWVNVGWVTFEV